MAVTPYIKWVDSFPITSGRMWHHQGLYIIYEHMNPYWHLHPSSLAPYKLWVFGDGNSPVVYNYITVALILESTLETWKVHKHIIMTWTRDWWIKIFLSGRFQMTTARKVGAHSETLTISIWEWQALQRTSEIPFPNCSKESWSEQEW